MERPSYRTLLGRIRYQLLSAVMVTVSAANIVVLFLIFGKGAETKSYLLALNVVAVVQLILATPFEQFVYYYLRAKKESPIRSDSIFTACMACSTLLGFVTAALFFCFDAIVMELATPNLSLESRSQFAKVLHQLLIGLALGVPCQLIQNRASAEGRITLSYLFSLIPGLTLGAGMVLAWQFHLPINAVAGSWSLGYFIAFCVGIGLSGRRLLHQFPLRSLQLMPLFIESTKMRTAHNIHNVCLLQGINIATSGLADNIASIFLALKRASDALLFVINSPIQRTLPNILVASQDGLAHAGLTGQIKRLQGNLLIAYIMIAALSIPALHLLTTTMRFSALEQSFVWGTAVLLLIYSAMISLEAPYSLVCLWAGSSRVFWASNFAFAACLLTLIHFELPLFTSFALPVAMVAAQSIVLVNNTINGQRILHTRSHVAPLSSG